MKRHSFPLFSSHLELAHALWKEIVRPDDLVIDLTLGNGHDTQFLSELQPYKVIALDIQEKALQEAKKLIVSDIVEFILADHALYPDQLENGAVKLAVYNLGYLPGGEKTVTTLTATTLASLQKMVAKICPGGALSITCYPGHEEGCKEEEAILAWTKTLPPSIWMVSYTQWPNREKSPSLFWLVRSYTPNE